MSRSLSMGFAVVCLLVLGPALATPYAGTAQAPAQWPPKNYQEFRDSAAKFALLHHKDWKVVPGLGDVVVSFVQNNVEAVIVVERMQLREAFDTSSQDFLDTETEVLKLRHPAAQGLSSRRLADAQKGVVFDFTRGGNRGPEQVRQYSFLAGTLLFRLTCISPPAQFKKYELDYANVARSVRAL